MAAALERLERQLHEEVDCVVQFVVPSWVKTLDFDAAISILASDAQSVENCMETVRVLRLVRCILDTLQKLGIEEGVNAIKKMVEPQQPVVRPRFGVRCSFALARVAYGEMLESFAAFYASKICAVSETPVANPERAVFSRLCNDAYLVAMWTSAHAEYVACLKDVCNSSKDSLSDSEMLLPAPEVSSTISMSSAPDLSELFERRGCDEKKEIHKKCSGIFSVLCRCTNAGSRGWETTLTSALKSSESATRFCAHILFACLSGMTPLIHPGSRPDWRKRHVLRRTNKALLNVSEMRSIAHYCPLQIKECCRSYLSVLLGLDPASKEAFLAYGSSTGNLSCPPLDPPHPSLQAALQMICSASVACSLSKSADVAQTLKHLVLSDTRVRKKAGVKTVKHPWGHMNAVLYSSTWLGGRSPANAVDSTPLATTVSSMLLSCFKADFVPFWLHARRNGKRVSRLDEVQYEAIHGMNAVHQLASLLPVSEALSIQRLALRRPDAALLSLDQTAALLKVHVPHSEAKSCSEKRFYTLSAHAAAKMLHFARCAVLKEQLLAYDLGPGTRAMQVAALCKRLVVEELHGEEAVEKMPIHATNLCICTECKRVCNACQDGSGKDLPFNELVIFAESNPTPTPTSQKRHTPIRAPTPTSQKNRARYSLEKSSVRNDRASPPRCSRWTAASATRTCAAPSAPPPRCAPPSGSRRPRSRTRSRCWTP